MLKVTLIECILRGLPETILFVWAMYLLNDTPMKYIRIIFTAIIITIIIFIIRLLPINLGINSFLAIILLIYLNIVINKFTIKQSISTTILIFAIEYFAEMINMIVLQFLKLDVNTLFKDPMNKVLYSSPSLVLLIIIVLIIYKAKERLFST